MNYITSLNKILYQKKIYKRYFILIWSALLLRYYKRINMFSWQYMNNESDINSYLLLALKNKTC